MLRPSPRLKDSGSLGGIRGWNVSVFLSKRLLAILRLDIAGKHCFRSEFGLESYLVQFSVVVSESACRGGVCTTDERKVEPRRKHHYGKLSQCLVFMLLPPTSLLTVWTIITEHTTFTNVERVPIWRRFSGEIPLFFSFHGSPLKIWTLEVCFHIKATQLTGDKATILLKALLSVLGWLQNTLLSHTRYSFILKSVRLAFIAPCLSLTPLLLTPSYFSDVH